jgi:hypothetical protein
MSVGRQIMTVLNIAEINKLSVEKALEKIRGCDA